MERRVFPAGKDSRKRPYEDFRWSRFKHFAPAEMYTVVGEHVFPFLRTLGGDESTYAHHMKDARFTIPTPALLAKVVDLLDAVPMEDRDTKGDLYEYMLVSCPNGSPHNSGPQGCPDEAAPAGEPVPGTEARRRRDDPG
jgi:type I restriction enzyme M protein